MEIGAYKLEWINDDEIKVTKDLGFRKVSITLCGGDMETVLDVLFITVEKELED